MADEIKFENAPILHAVTVVKVGEPVMVEVRPCACYRTRYYVNGIDNHYVRAADYDALLSSLASLREERDDVLRESAWNHGSAHEEDCPADDTCSCKWQAFNDRVNKACGAIVPNDLSFMARANAAEDKLSHYPAVWREDSSLATWFPLTAEEIVRLREERDRLLVNQEKAV